MPKPIICYDYFGNQYTFDESEYIERISVYAVTVDRGQILMVKDSSSDRWEFPGGGVERIETELDALKREVLEETRLLIKQAPELITSFTEYFYDLPTKQPWKAIRKFYRVSDYDGNLLATGNNDDVSEASFVNKSEFARLETTGTIQKVAKLAAKF